MAREVENGGLDAALLGHARHLEIVGEADTRHVRTCDELGRRVQLVEQLVDNAPNEVLAEIRDLNVFLAAGNERLGSKLFPVAYSKSGVISENRMLDVMYRIGLRGKATVHGFRGLASTVLNESGEFESDWIEAQLAHSTRGVRAAYNSAKYLKHRRAMMIWWANYLEAAEGQANPHEGPLP